jgi:hypothetical protein
MVFNEIKFVLLKLLIKKLANIMYYNRFVNRFILDAFDYFLISSFIASRLAPYLKRSLSEEASMERLKDSILNESRLIEPSKSILSSEQAKIQTIYRLALDSRGGSNPEYQLAEKIERIAFRLAYFLRNRELRAKFLKIIFTKGRLVLQLVLSVCNIDLYYLYQEPLSQEFMVAMCITGSATGFICSWFSVATILVTPPAAVLAFFLRSLCQQTLHNVAYKQFVEKFLTDKNFEEKITNMLSRAQKRVENSKSITIEYLNWNKNPAIKEAAERLGIFENAPSATGPVNLNALDLDPGKISDKLDVIPKVNKLTKAKLVNLLEFIQGIIDRANKPNKD